MQVSETYQVQIYVGLRVGYTEEMHSINDVTKICDEWLEEHKDCVTITPTEFRYVDGWEPGAIVGMINYPRFPRSAAEIKSNAMELGEILRTRLGQFRVSVVTPTHTYLLENE